MREKGSTRRKENRGLERKGKYKNTRKTKNIRKKPRRGKQGYGQKENT